MTASGRSSARSRLDIACSTPRSTTRTSPRSARRCAAPVCPAKKWRSPARPPAGTTGTRTRSPAPRSHWTGSRSTTSTCTSSIGRTQRSGYVEAWRALVDLQRDGPVRSIGVSNFTEEHLRRVIDETGVTPAVNQIELHPYFPQEEMREVHDGSASAPSRGARSANDGPFDEPPIAAAAEAHGVSPAQVIIRWQSAGALPIPKSADPERQRATPTCSGSSSRGRVRRSRRSAAPTGVYSAATPISTRRCEVPTGSSAARLQHVEVPFGVAPVLPLLVEDGSSRCFRVRGSGWPVARPALPPVRSRSRAARR